MSSDWLLDGSSSHIRISRTCAISGLVTHYRMHTSRPSNLWKEALCSARSDRKKLTNYVISDLTVQMTFGKESDCKLFSPLYFLSLFHCPVTSVIFSPICGHEVLIFVRWETNLVCDTKCDAENADWTLTEMSCEWQIYPPPPNTQTRLISHKLKITYGIQYRRRSCDVIQFPHCS
jgi:hypothetical protein